MYNCISNIKKINDKDFALVGNLRLRGGGYAADRMEMGRHGTRAAEGIGGTVGAIGGAWLGGVIGGAIGSFFGPAGTATGAWIGKVIGTTIGAGAGSAAGKSN